MMSKVTKQDKLILKSFLANSIPEFIKEQIIESWDLMVCYEEVFNYTHGILHGSNVDFSKNSFGTGPAFIFDNEYLITMRKIAYNSDDTDLIIHCYLTLAALAVLKKYCCHESVVVSSGHRNTSSSL